MATELRATFTPGPWRANRHTVVSDTKPDSANYSPLYTEEMEKAAYGGYLIAESIAPENCAIIAAAPEMYRALETIVALAPTSWSSALATAVSIARDALAKAEDGA